MMLMILRVKYTSYTTLMLVVQKALLDVGKIEEQPIRSHNASEDRHFVLGSPFFLIKILINSPSKLRCTPYLVIMTFGYNDGTDFVEWRGLVLALRPLGKESGEGGAGGSPLPNSHQPPEGQP